jgi:hypothetical protein
MYPHPEALLTQSIKMTRGIEILYLLSKCCAISLSEINRFLRNINSRRISYVTFKRYAGFLSRIGVAIYIEEGNILLCTEVGADIIRKAIEILNNEIKSKGYRAITERAKYRRAISLMRDIERFDLILTAERIIA